MAANPTKGKSTLARMHPSHVLASLAWRATALRVRRKDRSINRNLRRFAAERKESQLPPRETELSLEILIPCYNHGQYLEDALDSISDSDANVTVVDDASTDDTGDVIQHLKSTYNFSVITNGRNHGQWASLNKAVQSSSRNLFVVLNADDALLPYSIELVRKVFDDQADIRLFGGSSIWFTRSATLRLAKRFPSRLDYTPKLHRFEPEEALRFTNLSCINMTMSSSAFVRSAWEAVGCFLSFDERICSHDDRDFQMRVASLFPIAIVDEPLAWYRTVSSTRKPLE